MSTALRAREQAAIKRLAGLLCTEIDPGKSQAQVLEELVGAADTLLGPAIGEAAKPVTCQQCALHDGLFTHRTVTPDEIDEDPDTSGIDHEADANMWREVSTAKDAVIDRLTAELAAFQGTDEQGPESA